MLGDLIGEEQGKVSVKRVLESAGGPKLEITIQTNAKVLGIKMTNLGTYSSALQPGGFLYGEGQGVLMSKAGDMVTWTGSGTGRMKPGGGVSYRGAVYFANPSPKLERLNGMAVVYEHESDANDKITTKYWEWK